MADTEKTNGKLRIIEYLNTVILTIIAIVSGLAVGILKETVIDYFIRNSTMDLADVTLTWSGSFALVFLLLIIRTIKTEL
jgi:hypothetical protein